MPPETTKSSYWQGVRAGVPFLLVIAPFSMLFGIVATEAGFTLIETFSYSFFVVAGASQFTAVQLLSEHAPTLIVISTSLAVNLRMAMYSASLTPHLGKASLGKRALVAYLMVDQAYACAILAYEKHPYWSVSQKLAYYFGVSSALIPLWLIFTMVGAIAGSAIPPEFALDFAVPITFLAMVAPMLRSIAHVAAAVVAIGVSLALASIPYSLGLLIAGAVGMIVGAQVELLMSRKAALA